MKTANIVTFLFVLTTLSACGGGGSSSGGQAQKDVTSCITREVDDPNAPATRRRVIFTNTCDFIVNFAAGIVGIVSESRTVLGPNQMETRLDALTREFIACRPPSIGIDTDDGTGLALDCS